MAVSWAKPPGADSRLRDRNLSADADSRKAFTASRAVKRHMKQRVPFPSPFPSSRGWSPTRLAGWSGGARRPGAVRRGRCGFGGFTGFLVDEPPQFWGWSERARSGGWSGGEAGRSAGAWGTRKGGGKHQGREWHQGAILAKGAGSASVVADGSSDPGKQRDRGR